MKTVLAALLVAAIGVGPITGAPLETGRDTRDHLEPDEWPLEWAHFDYYNDIIKSVLREGFAPDVKMRMLLLPSFRPEVLIGIRRKEGGAYEIIYLESTVQLWDYSLLRDARSVLAEKKDEFYQSQLIKKLEARLPADPKDVKLGRCVMQLSDAEAKTVLNASELLLRQTRPYSPREGMSGSDGYTYHFWQITSREMKGQIWVPSANSRPGRMIGIMATLVDACEKKDRTLVTRAVHEAGALSKDLGSK